MASPEAKPRRFVSGREMDEAGFVATGCGFGAETAAARAWHGL